MRAVLRPHRAAHWRLLDHGDNSCEFIFPDGVRFVFFGKPHNRSVSTARVVCEVLRLTHSQTGGQEDIQAVYFYGRSTTEESYGFSFPANCVWVAGEVEL